MEKYSIIYADPPWHYRTCSEKGQGRSAEKHYPTMSIEQIKACRIIISVYYGSKNRNARHKEAMEIIE